VDQRLQTSLGAEFVLASQGGDALLLDAALLPAVLRQLQVVVFSGLLGASEHIRLLFEGTPNIPARHRSSQVFMTYPLVLPFGVRKISPVMITISYPANSAKKQRQLSKISLRSFASKLYNGQHCESQPQTRLKDGLRIGLPASNLYSGKKGFEINRSKVPV
jgi:hypothetical protein